LLGTTGSFASFDVGNCNNCHGAAYADHWLTNPVADSEGWLQPSYQADDNTANANVIQPTAPPMLATP
jgi:hypothetical protein